MYKLLKIILSPVLLTTYFCNLLFVYFYTSIKLIHKYFSKQNYIKAFKYKFQFIQLHVFMSKFDYKKTINKPHLLITNYANLYI